MWTVVVAVALLFLAPTDGFSLRSSSVARRTASSSTALAYKVRLINKKKNSDTTFECPPTKYILDEAEVQVPAFIPWSCRTGSCSSCIGMISEGTVDQSNQIFLDNDKVDMGYVLTCVAYPQSDVTIEVDIEAEYYDGVGGGAI